MDGILAEEIEIDEPILTIKTKNGALSKISKEGLSAVSIFTPIMMQAKKLWLKLSLKQAEPIK